MGADAGRALTGGQVRGLLEQLERAATREACWSCECLQGYITQLKQDAAEEARSLVEAYEVRPERLHGCLGCEPCPPAEVFTTHLKMR